MEYLSVMIHQFTYAGNLELASQYASWYASMEKPFFAPPAFAFGLAWGVIYPLIAAALLYAFYLWSKRRVPLAFLGLFLLNMALNLTFTATLMTTRDNGLISLHIILVLGTLGWLMIGARRFSRVIFWLLMPYLLWVAFATVLQLSITAMN